MTTATIYRCRSQRQRATFQGHLIGCTETAFAMLVDSQSFGGCLVNEAIVRSLSGEAVPDPESPGLNQTQLVKVARQLHIPYWNATGQTWDDVLRALDANERIVAQLWYAEVGGNAIGHAFYLERRRVRRGVHQVAAVDPMKGRREWYLESDIRRAMEVFGRKAGQAAGGLLYGHSRPIQFMAV